MNAKITAQPALRLREMPNGKEMLRIPYEAIVTVENWDASQEWACITYHGITGYAMKEYLLPVEFNEAEAECTLNSSIESPDFIERFSYSTASGVDRPYVVYQVTLKEKLIGTGSGNLTELEDVINHFFSKGYRLHSMSTSNGGSKGSMLGDRIQATLVFEKVGLFG